MKKTKIKKDRKKRINFCLWITAIIVFIIFIILPRIIFAASSSDWLNYYGICLSTVGTIFLGCVALWQNYILNRNSQKKDEPIFGFTNTTCGLKFETLSFTLNNISENCTRGFLISNPKMIVLETGKEYTIDIFRPNKLITFPAHEKAKFLFLSRVDEIINNIDNIENIILKFQMEYTDINGNKHIEPAEIKYEKPIDIDKLIAEAEFENRPIDI